MAERNRFQVEPIALWFSLVEHDLVGKPVSTFPDHALGRHHAGRGRPRPRNVFSVEMSALGSAASETTRMRTCMCARSRSTHDIAAPPALEEMHMRIVRQRLRDHLVRRPIGRDRGADEFGCDNRRGRIVEIEPEVVGKERMDIAADDDGIGHFACRWMRLSSRARFAGYPSQSSVENASAPSCFTR